MFVWRYLSSNLAWLTVLSALAAYWQPAIFLPFGHVFLWLFAATMFALGITLEPADAREAFAHPGRILIGVGAQYAIMPALGFGAAWLATELGATPALALGFIIVGCAPGAMASNVITYLAGGLVAFSIAMTLVATMLSPLLTPALVEWLGHALMAIPFWPMMGTILWTVVLPLVLGIGARRRLGRLLPAAETIAPGLASLAIIIICSYAVAANHDRIGDTPPMVAGLVILLNGLGYALGWLVGRLFSFPQAWQLTLSIEIGMQNAGLGVALALKHFAPETALPGALFAVWCIVTAAGLTRWLKGRSPVPAAV